MGRLPQGIGIGGKAGLKWEEKTGGSGRGSGKRMKQRSIYGQSEWVDIIGLLIFAKHPTKLCLPLEELQSIQSSSIHSEIVMPEATTTQCFLDFGT